MVKIENGKDTETYDERINRIANHIKNTNENYVPVPVEVFFNQQIQRKTELNDILDHIKIATHNSRIVVGRVNGGLNYYFENTAAGWFVKNHGAYVGTYHGGMIMSEVIRELKGAI